MPPILVDAFGTIVEPRPAWLEVRKTCFREAVEGSGVSYDTFQPIYDEERRRDHERAPGDHREFDFVARFRRAFDRAGAPNAAASAEAAAARYHAFQGRLVAPLADAAAGLEALARLGPLALVSNYPHGPSLVRALERLKLAHFFRATIVSGDIGWLKPSPVIFHKAAAALGAEPAECVMVGNDAADDVAGARRAGMHAILVAYPRGTEHPVPPGALGAAADLLEAATILRDRVDDLVRRSPPGRRQAS